MRPLRRAETTHTYVRRAEKFMCRAAKCNKCGKTTWAGCGQHIDSVRRAVPAGQWCAGHSGPASTGGFFSRLFRRL